MTSQANEGKKEIIVTIQEGEIDPYKYIILFNREKYIREDHVKEDIKTAIAEVLRELADAPSRYRHSDPEEARAVVTKAIRARYEIGEVHGK